MSKPPPPPILPPPRLPVAVLRLLLPRAERDEVMADVLEEFGTRSREDGSAEARRWLWKQSMGSAPSLFRWTSWRGLTGFEPHANEFRPGGPMLKHLMADLRFASRRLRARPSYSVLAILTLALGIGGTAAVFGVARPLVLDPLPYGNEKSVVTFWFGGSWTEQEFVYLRGKFPGFKSVAAYRQGDMTLRDGDSPARLLPGITASAELFDVLGAPPMMGRTFQLGDDVQGAEPIVLLSYGVWQELGANPSIVGSRVTLDGTPRTVVGVMPRGFWFPDPSVRIWTPRPLNPEGQNGSYNFVGQVAPGQDPNNMAGPISALVKIIDERFDYSAEWDKTKGAEVFPIRESLLGKMQPAILATFAAMGLILLIACTNVAALMLGQVEGRAPELAVRAALGANRRRLTQPLVVEALVIGVVAGLLGAGLAAVGFGTLAHALPLGAWSESAQFDWTMFASAMVFAIIAVLLVVLIPSTSLFRHEDDLHGTLSRSRTGGIQGGGARVERGLVVAEVALAMLIASGAGLLVRSVTKLYAIDPGFTPSGVAVIDIVAGAGMTPPQRLAAMDELVNSVGALPGVTSSAMAMKLPLRGNGNNFGITVEGQPDREESSTFFRVASQDYFKTMGIAVTRGRTFDNTDQPDSTQLSVVINETLAKMYFPGVDPIGRRVGGGFGVPQRIVGVVADVAEGALLDPPKPTRYYLARQVWFGNNTSLVVKTSRPGDAEALLDMARTTVNRVAPNFAVQGTSTMNRVFDNAVGPARQIMTLLTLLSALALLLGAVGIYGVISHFVARRKRDWAIRVALGLPGRRVVTKILGQGATLVVAGIVIGAFASVAMSKLLASFLFGVTGIDPLAFAGASAVVLITGLIAAFVPARRAGSVDPALVLREQ
ncbi:MAG: ADOP family duplicated permease [Gemmatimonadota bacterium]